MNQQSDKTRILQTGLYFAASLVVGMFLAVRGATLPNLAGQVGVGLGQIGFILTASSLGFLVGNFTMGHLYDRFKGHYIIRTGIVGMMLMIASIPFVKQLVWLFPVFMMIGFFRSMIIMGTSTLPLWIYGSRAGSIMNASMFFFGGGSVLGPILVSNMLNQTGSTQWVFWICAAGFLIVLPAALMIPSPPIRKEPVSNPHSAAAHTINENRRVIFLLALFLVFYVGAEIGFGSWLTTYAQAQLPADLMHRAYRLTSVFWICMTLGRLLSVLLSTKFDTQKLLMLDLGGILTSLVIILIGNGSWGMLFAGTVLLGISMASIFPLTFTLAEEVMDVTGRISSLLFVGASTGALIFPLLMGRLIEFVSPISIMVALLAMMLVDAVIFGMLYLAIRRHKTKLRG